MMAIDVKVACLGERGMNLAASILVASEGVRVKDRYPCTLEDRFGR